MTLAGGAPDIASGCGVLAATFNTMHSAPAPRELEGRSRVARFVAAQVVRMRQGAGRGSSRGVGPCGWHGRSSWVVSRSGSY